MTPQMEKVNDAGVNKLSYLSEISFWVRPRAVGKNKKRGDPDHGATPPLAF